MPLGHQSVIALFLACFWEDLRLLIGNLKLPNISDGKQALFFMRTGNYSLGAELLAYIMYGTRAWYVEYVYVSMYIPMYRVRYICMYSTVPFFCFQRHYCCFSLRVYVTTNGFL